MDTPQPKLSEIGTSMREDVLRVLHDMGFVAPEIRYQWLATKLGGVVVRVDEKALALEARCAALEKALTEIAGRWSDDSDHARMHNPKTCDAVVCVAKHALEVE